MSRFSVDIAEIETTNRSRVERWHPGFPGDDWTGADWANAMGGECGEAQNVVKKLRRIDLGVVGAKDPPRDVLVDMLADEIGDTIAYALLLAEYYGIDAGAAICRKFNSISTREQLPERLPEPNSVLL